MKKEAASVAELKHNKAEPVNANFDTSVTVTTTKAESDPEPQSTRSISIDVLKASSVKKQVQQIEKPAMSSKEHDSSVKKETTPLPNETKSFSISVKKDNTTDTGNDATADISNVADDAQTKPRKRTVPVSPPPFKKIESVFPPRVLWAKLCIRNFLLRFDSYAKIPGRFNTALDDIGAEWDDRMYKSIVTVAFKFLSHDKSVPPAIEHASVDHYFGEIERTVGNIQKVIRLVDEFLLKNAIIEESILLQPIDVEAEDGFDQEYKFLHVLTTLIGVAGQTSVVRNALNDESELLRTYVATMNQEIAKAEEAFNKVLAKIRATRKEVSQSPPMYAQPKTSEPRKSKKEQYQDLMAKEVAARAMRNRKIAKARELVNFQISRVALRTRPLGTDHFGNTYWRFLPRAVDVVDWRLWIVVEKNSAMPNSLQQSVRRNGASPTDEEEQQSGVFTASQSARSRNKLTVSEPGTGELYYFEITSENLKKCIDWLDYQERLYTTYKNGGRKHRLLSSGLDTEAFIVRLIRNLRLIQSETRLENK